MLGASIAGKVGLGGGEGGWSWGELGVGACGGLGVGVGLNSWGGKSYGCYILSYLYGACTVLPRGSV